MSSTNRPTGSAASPEAEPEPLPDASSVLRLLRGALEAVSEDADLTIRLGGLDEAPTGTPIVDAQGLVVATVTDDRDRAAAGDDAELLAALVASYGYVLEAQRAVDRLAGRVDELEQVAYRDPLTGLLNRRAWQEAVQREQARCARNPRPVAVVVIDLDRLKELNDERGHIAGDVLLRVTGGLLREVLRPADIVARIGGDEFAALLVDVTDQDPEAFADRLQHHLAVEGVSASVGVAIDDAGRSLEATFQAADDAMYHRKTASRRPGRHRA